MPSIHHFIMRKRKFVGRKEELQAMERLLQAKHDEWHILHFYGSAGMGKTVLLQQFLQLHKDEFPMIYIDGHSGFQTEEQFLDALSEQLHHIHPAHEKNATNVLEQFIDVARQSSIFVLLLDGLDQCRPIFNWLKTTFLHQLPVHIRVYTAGRAPFDDWQTSFGFESIVRNVQMKPFGKAEWTEYAAACGITDAHLLYQIGFISQGNPLAVALICNQMMEKGQPVQLSEDDYRHFIALFDKHLLSEKQLDGVNGDLLALASLTYTFDQELLEHMMGQQIDKSEFSQLCQSSFVKSHEDGGWMVNNGIRWWLRVTIKERFPSAYEQYKQRAANMLEQRISQTSKEHIAKRLGLSIGKFFLQDTLFMHLVYFGSHEKFEVRAAKEEELPLLAQMYQHNLRISPPYLEDSSHQEQYFFDVWQVDPQAFQIIEYEGQRVSFLVRVYLSDAMRAIFGKIPTTQKWMQARKYTDEDLFYWTVSMNHPTAWETVHFFLQHLFLPMLPNRRVICQLILPDQDEFLRHVGFDHVEGVDYTTSSGLRLSFYELDSRASGQPLVAASTAEHELAEWVRLTKQILSHYTVLRHQLALLEQCRQLWHSDMQHEQIAEHVQLIIEEQLNWLKEGSRQQKIQAQILQYAYIKKHGTHETVAALLDLPPSTYYRQLKKLIHSIASMLQSQAWDCRSATDP